MSGFTHATRPKRISIVIVARNEIAHLRRSMPIVLGQQVDIPFDVLVIDSGSTDGSIEYIRSLSSADSRVSSIEVEAFHHARTRNLGATLVTGELLVYLGGDAEPIDTSWLQSLVLPIIRRPGVVVASYGRQVPRADADVSNSCRIQFNYGPQTLLKNQGRGLSPRETYFFSSVNCCVDRRYVDMPIFDPSFRVNEDVSLSKRIIDQGMSIAYRADATVVHSHNYSIRAMFQRSFDNGITYAQLGVFGTERSRISRDGVRYLLSSLRRIGRTSPLESARFVAFFSASALGVTLGTRYGSLPRSWRARFSKYGVVG